MNWPEYVGRYQSTKLRHTDLCTQLRTTGHKISYSSSLTSGLLHWRVFPSVVAGMTKVPNGAAPLLGLAWIMNPLNALPASICRDTAVQGKERVDNTLSGINTVVAKLQRPANLVCIVPAWRVLRQWCSRRIAQALMTSGAPCQGAWAACYCTPRRAGHWAEPHSWLLSGRKRLASGAAQTCSSSKS